MIIYPDNSPMLYVYMIFLETYNANFRFIFHH